MIGTYNPVLVALSVLVGVLAFHVALDFADRASAVRGRGRTGWIVSGGAVAGLGVWSLHLLGMLALRLRLGVVPVAVNFKISTMLAAAGIAAIAMTPALLILRRPWTRTRGALLAGGLLGGAMVGTHYVAITGMRVPAHVSHRVSLVVIVIVVAPIASAAALWFSSELGADRVSTTGRRLSTAVALGAAATFTHYTAMAAMRLTPTGLATPRPAGSVPATPGVAALDAAGIITLLTLALLASWLDRRVRARLDLGEEHARLYREASAAEERQRFLLEAARALASSLDLQAALAQVTRLFVSRFADFCLVYLRAPDGSYVQAAAAHSDPTKAHLLDELGGIYRPDVADPKSVVGEAVRTRRPVVVSSTSDEQARQITTDHDALRIFRALSPTSYVVVPLVARGEVLGVTTVIMSASGRRLDAADVASVELLAARVALALDNARLYTETRDARDQVIRASQLEAQLMQARLDALRAQLNPHFLFNALNTVAMLVRREANDDALRAVVSLSEVLRRALVGQAEQEVPLREEIELVEHYLQVERLRFRDRLSVDIDVEPDVLGASVPGLLLQPLVENAVRHGVARRGGAGRIEISAHRREGRLLLEVRDNGPGFPDGWEVASSGRVGLANTRERLSRLYGGSGRFEARNLPSGGAVVAIEIPFRAALR